MCVWTPLLEQAQSPLDLGFHVVGMLLVSDVQRAVVLPTGEAESDKPDPGGFLVRFCAQPFTKAFKDDADL